MSEKQAARVALAFAVLMTAVPVFAHSGHDHGHWSSPAVHAILLLVSVGLIGLGVWLSRSFKKIEKKQK